MEVVYEGIRLTPAQIVTSALQEGVHVIGLSILSGSHRELIPGIIDGLREAGVDAPVVVGGIIPEADVPGVEGGRRRGGLHPEGLRPDAASCATSSRSWPSATGWPRRAAEAAWHGGGPQENVPHLDAFLRTPHRACADHPAARDERDPAGAAYGRPCGVKIPWPGARMRCGS